MKIIFKPGLIAIAMLIGITLNAQNKPLTFGIKTGLNLSSFSGDTKIKSGFNAGVTVDYSLPSNFYLLSGLEFTTKGAKISDNLKNNLSYLQLPVHIGYKLTIADNTNIIFHAGPYIAYATHGKWKIKSGDTESSIDAFDDTAQTAGIEMKRLDFGVGFGIGVEFGKFNINAGCDFGAINISDFDTDKWIQSFYPGDPSVKNMNISISLGYKF